MSKKIEKILTFGSYYKKKLGLKLYKVPIALSGFTCPNIDGTKAKGGCTFCENESFSPNYNKSKEKVYLSSFNVESSLINRQIDELHEQFNLTTKKLKQTHNAQKFIVYFQAFTNSYAPIETLKKLYEEALTLKDVVGISIGTRADSINDEILSYLKELSQTHEVWVEYGVQSVKDETLRLINRAESAKDVLATVKKTYDMGLNVCTHFIFGLPNESQEDMLNTLKETLKCGVNSIKIHPLYVVKNTALANDFKADKFIPITQDEYLDTLVKAIALLPKDVVIQRVSAGISDESLLAPSWCGESKNIQMKKIKAALRKAGFDY